MRLAEGDEARGAGWLQLPLPPLDGAARLWDPEGNWFQPGRAVSLCAGADFAAGRSWRVNGVKLPDRDELWLRAAGAACGEKLRGAWRCGAALVLGAVRCWGAEVCFGAA